MGNLIAVKLKNYNGSYSNFGGICGELYSSVPNVNDIKNCFNVGEFVVNETDQNKTFACGGICGTNYSSGAKINNCYSRGKMPNDVLEKQFEAWRVSPILGGRGEPCILSNNYYLEDIDPDGQETKGEYEKKTADFMKTEDFVTLLNKEEETWEIRDGENEGYPVIKNNK